MIIIIMMMMIARREVLAVRDQQCAVQLTGLRLLQRPQGEHFQTWAMQLPSLAKLPEETMVPNVRSEDPVEVPDKVQQLHGNKHS